MHKNWIVLALAAAVAVGCGPSEEAQKAAAAEARKAEWSSIELAKKALDGKRADLAAKRAEASAEDAQPGAADEVAALEAEVATASDELYKQLAAYINGDPPVQDEPLTPPQLAAFRMKSDEDMLIAREYIERGGDYRKAIEIYETALAVDSDNEKLKAALADAEAKRFMTEERLAGVEKGMTEDEVVAVLGRPYTRNVKNYPETKVTAWFYPTDDAGNAAGVFFKPGKDAKVVYQTKIDAVKAETREVGSEGSEAGES